MSITVQDVSLIQKRINLSSGGYLEYSRNENGQRVRNESGSILFSNIPEDNLKTNFEEAVQALSTLAKVISNYNKKSVRAVSPLKGRKLGPRKAKQAVSTATVPN